jgi:hypothetical protein
MQTFLRNKGYDIAVDGIQGPLTAAAAADWRTHRDPHGWNTAHGGAPSAAVPGGAPPATAVVPPKKTPPKKTAPVRTVAAAPAAATVAPGPSLEEQTQAIVDSILNPLLANVRSTQDARANAGQQAIGGYTSNAMKQLAGINFQAPYQGAASGANAVNDAELSLLQGQGGGLASQVGAKLMAAGQDAAPVTGQINADTAGAAGAGYASGGSTVQQLLSEGAAAGTYGKKLPGIEALAGSQATKGFQGQVAADTVKQIGDITATAPQLIQSTLANLQTKQSQDTSLKINAILASGYDPNTGTLTPAARTALASLVGTDPSALAGGSASTVASAATAAAAAGKISPSVSKILGYAATADGSPIVTKTGQIIPVTKTGEQGAPKAPTGSQLSKMVDGWFDGKTTTQHTPVLNQDGTPVTDANGAPIYRTTDGPQTGRLDYFQALRRLKALNVTDVQARQLLNTRYARGQRGRGWLTNDEQAALAAAHLPAKATRYKSVAYLTPQQAAALQKAGKLPAGQTVGDKYVIDEGY